MQYSNLQNRSCTTCKQPPHPLSCNVSDRRSFSLIFPWSINLSEQHTMKIAALLIGLAAVCAAPDVSASITKDPLLVVMTCSGSVPSSYLSSAAATCSWIMRSRLTLPLTIVRLAKTLQARTFMASAILPFTFLPAGLSNRFATIELIDEIYSTRINSLIITLTHDEFSASLWLFSVMYALQDVTVFPMDDAFWILNDTKDVKSGCEHRELSP